MREFEALRAEVYRRGEEKKIKIKKTRRRVIALCVPLVLCVTAAGLLPQAAKNGGKADNMLSAPEFFRADDAQMEAVMDTEAPMTTPATMATQATQTADSDSLISSQVAVEVTSAEGWVWHSKDPQTILEISEALHAITGVQTQAYSAADSGQKTASTLDPGSYRIVFTDREGERIVYLLTEDYLEVVADHLQFAVTAKQYADLESLLTP